jgi:uncharacterized membrane protein YbhN (UPF0104 family)
MTGRLARAFGGHSKGPPALRRLVSLPTLLSLALAAGLLALLVTRFNIDLGSTWRHVRDGNPWLYLAALSINLAGLSVRALRWRLVAGNISTWKEAGGQVPGQAETTTLVLAGWFLNAVGWLRMGDAYRAYAFGRSARAPFPLSLGIIAAERVMDVFAVVPLFLLAILGTVLLGERGHTPLLFVIIAAVLAVAGLVLLLALMAFGTRLAGHMPPALRAQFLRFHEGALGSFRRIPLVGVLSLGVWLCEAARLYLVVLALGVPVSAPLALFVSLVNAVLTTIPLTPAGIGFAEPGMVGALSLAVTRAEAVAVAAADRAISYGSIVVLGGIALAGYELVWMRGRGKRQAATNQPDAETPPT